MIWCFRLFVLRGDQREGRSGRERWRETLLTYQAGCRWNEVAFEREDLFGCSEQRALRSPMGIDSMVSLILQGLFWVSRSILRRFSLMVKNSL